jgi:hypothetical protein
MRKTFLILWLLFPALCFAAAPSNVSLSDTTISDGEQITISGTNFGDHGPIVHMFDNFELGTSGNAIENQNATVGSWSQGLRASASYTNLYPRNGSMSMQAWCGTTNTEDYENVIVTLPNVTTVIQSYWVYIPEGQNWPGTGGDSGHNWKFSWMGGSARTFDNDYISLVTMGDPIHTVFTAGSDDNQTTARYGYGVEGGINTSDFNMAKGTWIRFMFYVKGGLSDGEVKFWQLSSEGNEQLPLTNTDPANTFTLEIGHNYTWVNFPGYMRGETGTYVQYDDIYVAYGDAAQARLEICNNQTYASSTNCAIFTPTSWSSSSIVANVRTGSFAEGNTAYLFVINSDGEVQATGVEVTIGPGITVPTRTESGGGGGGGGGCFIGALLP